jgi:hypothetical protein
LTRVEAGLGTEPRQVDCACLDATVRVRVVGLTSALSLFVRRLSRQLQLADTKAPVEVATVGWRAPSAAPTQLRVARARIGPRPISSRPGSRAI